MDRKFHERYTGYLLVAGDTDHVKSVEIRYTAEAGASITWVDASGDTGWKTSLRTDLGFRWAQENRFAYYVVPPDVSGPRDAVTLYAPRLGVSFKYALNKNVLFTEDAEILPNVVGAGRVVVASTAKLSSRLVPAQPRQHAGRGQGRHRHDPGAHDRDASLGVGARLDRLAPPWITHNP